MLQCDWESIGRIRAQAKRLRIIAAMWESRKHGERWGRTRIHDFDDAQARDLVASGLTFANVARLLRVEP